MARNMYIRQLIATFSLVMVFTCCLFVLPVVAAEESSPTVVPTAEMNPLAVVKEGFFYGIDKGRVTLADVDSGRKATYRLEEHYRVFHENAELPLEHIPPHSIVKLVLIEGQVREIILVLRAS